MRRFYYYFVEVVLGIYGEASRIRVHVQVLYSVKITLGSSRAAFLKGELLPPLLRSSSALAGAETNKLSTGLKTQPGALQDLNKLWRCFPLVSMHLWVQRIQSGCCPPYGPRWISPAA